MNQQLRAWLVGVVALAVIAALPGCDNPSGGGGSGPATIRFVNMNRTVDLWGNATQYSVKDISTLDTAWISTLAYGDTSDYREVNPDRIPSDGIFTISGYLVSGTTQTPTTWQSSLDLKSGESYTITLSAE